jgi:hypothetical protein
MTPTMSKIVGLIKFHEVALGARVQLKTFTSFRNPGFVKI